MKKICLLIVSVLLVTGCSVEYKLVINNDLSITEEAKLTGTNEFFDNYYKTTHINVLKSQLEVYKSVLDDSNYKYELIEDTTPYVQVTNTYSKVEDYIENSKLFNGYFDEIKYTENGSIKRIETIGFNDNNSDDPNRFTVKELKISIKCPFDVKKHNASNVNKTTNTYYYDLNEENDYKIILEYDTSTDFNPNKEVTNTLLIFIVIVVVTWVSIIIISKKNK